METLELDTAIEELELRLERLRALYEQYFIGIEKLEPSIPRKDVDRRIYVLRHEKIRNTGKRFKLQTLIQRYNTFQQYWMRICREIENGTYKRHVLRAERTIGPTDLMTVAARRRFGKEREIAQSSKPPGPVSDERSPSAPPGESTAPRRPTTVPPSSRSRTPTLVGLPTPPPPAALARPPADRPITRQPPDTFVAEASPQQPARRDVTPQERRSQHTPPLGSRPPPPTAFESLDLDMGFMGDWDPQAATGRSAKGPAARVGRGPSLQTPASPPPREEAARVAPPAHAVEPVRARLAPPPKPGRAAPAGPTAIAQPRRPAAPVIPDAGPPEEQTTRIAARPAQAAVPLPSAATAAKPRPQKPAAETSVTDARLRELHTRLQEANKNAGQKPVSIDGLAKSLRAAEAKLRAQHGNRRIDFEVVLKEGKPVVKPVVR